MYPMYQEFSGKIVLVTGGTRGIGAAISCLFAERGAQVVAHYRSRREDAEALQREMELQGIRVDLEVADIADSAAVTEMFQRLGERFGRLDILVNNAGIWPAEDVPLERLQNAQLHEVLAINLTGLMIATRQAIPLLRQAGDSAIVNIASTAGQRGEAFHSHYAATKGAVISLTKSLAVELAPAIRVNCVAPGWVDTEMTAGVLSGERRREIETGIPLGRVATPEEVAWPVLFLASSQASAITGEVLNVNGGSVLAG